MDLNNRQRHSTTSAVNVLNHKELMGLMVKHGLYTAGVRACALNCEALQSWLPFVGFFLGGGP